MHVTLQRLQSVTSRSMRAPECVARRANRILHRGMYMAEQGAEYA
jgi:hypothetical protein